MEIMKFSATRQRFGNMRTIIWVGGALPVSYASVRRDTKLHAIAWSIRKGCKCTVNGLQCTCEVKDNLPNAWTR